MDNLALGLGLVIGGLIAFASVRNWRFGFYGLLVYLPFAGLISLRTGQSTLGLLAKDLLFVVPSYVSFFLIYRYPIVKTRLPGFLVAAMAFLALLVLVQALNPNLPNFLVPLIGIKVWLLYLPMAFLAAASIREKEDVVRLFRLVVAVSVLPFAVAFLQRFGVEFIGRGETSAVLYGAGFDNDRYSLLSGFDDYGGASGGTLYRINGTFSANGMYTLYALLIISVSMTLSMIETDKRWRRFAQAMTLVSIVGAFLSGSRGVTFFVPMALAPALMLSRNVSALLIWGAAVPVIYYVTFSYTGIDVSSMLDFVLNYALYNTQEFGVGQLLGVFFEHPLGMGTGINTGSARYAFLNDDTAATMLSGLEVYYAKTVAELSLIGLIPVLVLMIAPLLHCARTARSGASQFTRQCAAGLAGFFLVTAVVSYKGWPLDVDPYNVMFWILVGVIYKMPFVVGAAGRQNRSALGMHAPEASPA